jgi:preprotein translocase subunit SecY
MSFYQSLLSILPEVKGPLQKKLSFKEKLKWTLIILVIFFVLGLIPLIGLGNNALSQFEFLSIVLAASFGSLISLGIGPIVTASIVLQLLNGSGIINFDTTTHEGKKRFQGTQKLLAMFFIIFEAFIFVFLGGLSPVLGFSPLLLVLQLIVGGFLIMLMDEVVSKWGFGSGLSLFIAAGVSQQIFVQTFSWTIPEGSVYTVGAFWRFLQALFTDPNFVVAGGALFSILATLFVFGLAVYAQSMKVEIPLSFGRIRGHGIRWPLNFLYTSNIPVILVAALMANIQLGAQFFAGGNTTITQLFLAPNMLEALITSSITFGMLMRALFYTVFMMLGAAVFSAFWVTSAGMDSKSQAKQMLASGLQVPGFRRDKRILERMLDRYIWPLAITGGLAVGLLAAFADLSGALSRGTGILLTVMIIYKLYEEVAQQHMMDMNPMMRKFMGK